MRLDPLRISLSSLIETSTLMGHPLEDRTPLRMAQDEAWIDSLQRATNTEVSPADQPESFYFGCIDFLVFDNEGQRRFLPIEFNGTGTGGITNISPAAMAELIAEFQQLVHHIPQSPPLVLVPFYHPSRLIYEKILLGQAIKEGFQQTLGAGRMVPLDLFLEHPEHYPEPLAVLAPLKTLATELHWDAARQALLLADRPVSASLHDVFCQNLVNAHHHRIQLDQFSPINRFFTICSDKGLVYHYMNQYLAAHPDGMMVDHIPHQYAHSRQELIDRVMAATQAGEKLLIKPHGGGIGTGIEFFLTPEPLETVTAKVDASIQSLGTVYGVESAGFPYTLCQFVNSAVIRKPGHPLAGHKYELRVVVYRSGNTVKACPAHVKIAADAYDPTINARTMLMNNHVGGSDPAHSAMFRLPLANRNTLELIDVSPEQLEAVCRFSTGFVGYVIQQFKAQPQCFTSSSFSSLAI